MHNAECTMQKGTRTDGPHATARTRRHTQGPLQSRW
jgi:hypothetical protein